MMALPLVLLAYMYWRIAKVVQLNFFFIRLCWCITNARKVAKQNFLSWELERSDIGLFGLWLN